MELILLLVGLLLGVAGSAWRMREKCGGFKEALRQILPFRGGGPGEE